MASEDTLGSPGAPPTELQPAGRVGRYFLLDKIGQGGMGVVYSAYDDALDRAVAIKLIHNHPQIGGADDQERLVREARTLARLQHPNVVAVYDAQTVGELVYVAMELVPGADLRAWRGERPRTTAEILEVFIQAGHGLAAAHAAGIVHRDFKPANVLVGTDGRVRVADFGLAQAVSADGAATGPSAQASGTPAYMSPEQHRREPITPRSDQFSFCVSLAEALGDRSPYDVDAVRDATARAPELGKLPAWLRAPLTRGLALAAEDRFPSMDVLLRALARDPARRRRRWLAIGAAFVLAALAVSSVVVTRGSAVMPGCGGDELAGIWDRAQRDKIGATFVASKLSFAATSWLGTASALDRYATRLQAARAATCAGAHPDPRRMACLDQRRQRLAATISVLAAADADIVENAGQAVQALPQLESCAEGSALLAQVPPPDDPSTRARVLVLRERLARAEALNDADKDEQALALATGVEVEARPLAYPPLIAEVALLRGVILAGRGEGKASEDAYYDAVYAGELGQHDEVVAQAWTELVWAVGALQRLPDATARLTRLADVALSRLGDPPALRGRYWSALAGVAAHQRHFDEMAELDKRALATYQRVLAANDRRVMDVRADLAQVAEGHGRFAEALAGYRQLLPAYTVVYGPEHPETVRLEMALGAVFLGMGRLEDAEGLFRLALAQRERIFGPDHADVATATSRLALTLDLLGRHDEALVLDTRALAIREKRFGPAHPTVATTVAQMGQVLLAKGDLAGARRLLVRALEIREVRFGPKHEDVADALERLVRLELREGRLADAEAHAARALQIREGAEPFPMLLGESVQLLGEVYLAAGKLDQARHELDRALAILERTETPAAVLAEARGLQARAAAR